MVVVVGSEVVVPVDVAEAAGSPVAVAGDGMGRWVGEAVGVGVRGVGVGDRGRGSSEVQATKESRRRVRNKVLIGEL